MGHRIRILLGVSVLASVAAIALASGCRTSSGQATANQVMSLGRSKPIRHRERVSPEVGSGTLYLSSSASSIAVRPARDRAFTLTGREWDSGSKWQVPFVVSNKGHGGTLDLAAGQSPDGEPYEPPDGAEGSPTVATLPRDIEWNIWVDCWAPARDLTLDLRGLTIRELTAHASDRTSILLSDASVLRPPAPGPARFKKHTFLRLVGVDARQPVVQLPRSWDVYVPIKGPRRPAPDHGAWVEGPAVPIKGYGTLGGWYFRGRGKRYVMLQFYPSIAVSDTGLPRFLWVDE